ncbi:MAG: hypothetical protein AB1489_07545 [Acidobacteriota bacterium]
MMRLAVLLLLLLSLSTTTFVYAHGGEDHGDEKSLATPTKGSNTIGVARAGEIEILLKHSETKPSGETIFSLFLTKFSTNESVSGASARLILGQPGTTEPLQVDFLASAQTGIYQAQLKLPAQARYRAQVDIKFNDLQERIEFGELLLSQPTTETQPTSTKGLALPLLSGLMLLMIATYIYLLRTNTSIKASREAAELVGTALR